MVWQSFVYLALASPCKMPMKHIKLYIYLWTVQEKKKDRDSIGDRQKDACGHFVDAHGNRIVDNSSSELCKK